MTVIRFVGPINLFILDVVKLVLLLMSAKRYMTSFCFCHLFKRTETLQEVVH